MRGSNGRYRTERGLLWPNDDRECARVVFDMVGDMQKALAITPGRSVALQAGGNCGVWARHLAERFETVITAEPDPVNFQCLVANTDGMNVICLQAALGAQSGWGDLNREAGNCGAHSVNYRAARFPILRIDDLSLPALDYLCLDIEGMEALAIDGGWQTIIACRPVIQIEDKGLSLAYGIQKGAVETRLAAIGYKVVDRPHRDVILAPGG